MILKKQKIDVNLSVSHTFITDKYTTSVSLSD